MRQLCHFVTKGKKIVQERWLLMLQLHYVDVHIKRAKKHLKL